jgi:hypothetical protein
MRSNHFKRRLQEYTDLVQGFRNDQEVKDGGVEPPISKPSIPMTFETMKYLLTNPYESLDKNFLLKLLEQILFFKNFDSDAVLKIYKNSELRSLEKGDWLFREGDIGKSVFLILAGSVNIVKKTKPDVLSSEKVDRTIANLREGATVGDYSLLGGENLLLNFKEVWDNYHGSQDGLDGYGINFIDKVHSSRSKNLLNHFKEKIQKNRNRRKEVLQGQEVEPDKSNIVEYVAYQIKKCAEVNKPLVESERTASV